jgi:hypothetical protein
MAASRWGGLNKLHIRMDRIPAKGKKALGPRVRPTGVEAEETTPALPGRNDIHRRCMAGTRRVGVCTAAPGALLAAGMTVVLLYR